MNATSSTPLKSNLAFGCITLLLVACGASVASALPAIHVIRGANQQGIYGSSFPAPLVVWVGDRLTERAISGLRVDFTPAAGIGLSSSYAITDEHGLASVTAIGFSTCTSAVDAQVSGFPNARVRFEGLAVEKATLTVVPGDLSSRLGAPLPAATNYTITGFVNGDTEDSAKITGSPVLTTTAKQHSYRANYAIKGGVGSLSAPNYRFVAGFGTLAILVGPNTGNQQAEPLEASIVAPPEEVESIEVRQALENLSADFEANQSAAGAQGESAALVHSAITPAPAVTPATAHSSHTHSAMLVLVAADTPNTSGAPVRAAALPKLVPVPAKVNNASARSALQPVDISTLQSNSNASVRTAIPSALTTPATIQPAYTQQAIRKAFTTPGDN